MTPSDAGAAVLGSLAALSMLVSCAWVAYLSSWRALAGATPSTRLCGAALVAYWLALLLFAGLATIGWFRIAIAVPLWIVGALFAHVALDGPRGWIQARRDGARIRRIASMAGRSQLRWILAGVGCVVTPPLLRALVAPPLAWDALTYHVVRAGRWVQHGDWARSSGPDAWGYYEYYPNAGDVYWAWAMLGPHSDAYLGIASILIWSSVLLGAYGSARAFGCRVETALLFALTIGTLPTVLGFMTSLLVDITLLAVVLLAVPFVRRIAIRARLADVALLLAATGVAAGVKTHGLMLPPIALGWVLMEAWRQRIGARATVALVCVGAVVACVGAPAYLRAWWETGSPLYPVSLSFGGREILAGNTQLSQLMSRTGPPDESHWMRMIPALFFGTEPRSLGFGPCAPFALPWIFVGLRREFGNAAARSSALLLLAWSFVLVAPVAFEPALWIPSWAAVSVRLVMTGCVLLALYAVLPRGPAPEAVWLAILVSNLFIGWPRGIGMAGVLAILHLLVIAIAAVVLGAVVRSLPLWRSGIRDALAAAVVVGVLSIAWHPVRDAHRYRLFDAMTRGETFDVHPSFPAVAWPLWRELDADTPRRIAAVAGWSVSGHNAFLYPLLGTRLQNEVLYVSPTRDGRPLDYGSMRDPFESVAGPADWIQRLRQQRIDTVAMLAPSAPVESKWILANPDLFERILCTKGSCLFRFSNDPPDAPTESVDR